MLSSKRTYVRPLEKGDFDTLLEMYYEPDSNKFIAPLLNKSLEFYKTFLHRKLEQNQRELGFWIALEKDTEHLMGTVNLNVFPPLSIYHVGCHLKAAYWGRGFATELLSVLIRYGFEEKGLTEIHGIFETDNMVSKKLMTRLGFNHDRTEMVEGTQLEVYKLLSTLRGLKKPS